MAGAGEGRRHWRGEGRGAGEERGGPEYSCVRWYLSITGWSP